MSLIEMRKSKPFEIKNKSASEAEIILYGAVGESFWDDSVSAKDFHTELKALAPTVNTITVRLNSPGGDVFDGITIYNRLKQHKAKKIIHIDGMAASIASIIAMAGDEIIMGEGAQMMIHKPWTMAMGNSLELEETISRLDDIEEQMIGIYARKTKLDRSELRNMLSKDYWMLAEEALELGFVDSTQELDFQAAASWEGKLDTAAWLRSNPKAVGNTKYVKNKVNELLNKVEGVLAR